MKSHRCTIEPLEARIAPAAAGVVTFTYDAPTGSLILTAADDFGHVVDIFQTGANTYRVMGDSHTFFDAAHTMSSIDIGKLTNLSIAGGGSADIYHLFNLRTLDALTFNGGAGDDELHATNVSIKGKVFIEGNAGSADVQFLGSSTFVGGDFTAQSSGGTASDFVNLDFEGQKTVIGGSLDFLGHNLNFGGAGPVNIGKGLSFLGSVGAGSASFHNDGPLTIGKLKTGESILFQSSAAGDNLTFDGRTVVLAGGLRMTGGAADDELDFESESSVKIGKLATGESVIFDGGGGVNSFLGGSPSTLAGGIVFNGGLDASTFSLAPQGPVSIGKLSDGTSIRFTGAPNENSFRLEGTTLTLAGGIAFSATAATSNELSIDVLGKASIGKLTTGESINYHGGPGGDSFIANAASLNLKGGIEFQPGNSALSAGPETNNFSLGPTTGSATIGLLSSHKSIEYIGGFGMDDVEIGVKNLTLAGGIAALLGDGGNSLNLASEGGGFYKIGTLGDGKSILYTGGSDTDSLAVNTDAALAGGIDYSSGGGHDSINLTSQGKGKIGKFGTGQSLLVKNDGTLGNGTSVQIGGYVTAGSVEITGGADADRLEMDGKVSLGKNAAGVSLQVIGNAGNDNVIAGAKADLTMAGSVSFDGGGDADAIDFEALNSLTVKGSVTFTGGAGDNDILGITAYTLSIGGGLSITSAEIVGIVADGTIGGDVSVHLTTSAANQSLYFTSHDLLPAGLMLKGKLTIDTDANTSSDTLTLTNVSIAKAIDVKLGDGGDTVTIDNLNAGDTFSLDTAGGTDAVSIERNDFFGNSVIKGLATIQLGAGNNDTLLIGKPTPAPDTGAADSTRVDFMDFLTTDGGAGTGDNRNDIGAENTFHGPARDSFAGFELSTLI